MANTLIIYYSNTGTIAGASRQLAEIMGADLYEIKPEKAYDKNMWTAWDVARAEREQNRLPKLATALPDVSGYDYVILGIPVWGYTLANPIMTLLKELDLTGKIVSAFWSFYDHDEKVVSDLKAMIQNGQYLAGLPLTQGVLHQTSSLRQALAEFAQKIR